MFSSSSSFPIPNPATQVGLKLGAIFLAQTQLLLLKIVHLRVKVILDKPKEKVWRSVCLLKKYQLILIYYISTAVSSFSSLTPSLLPPSQLPYPFLLNFHSENVRPPRDINQIQHIKLPYYKVPPLILRLN